MARTGSWKNRLIVSLIPKRARRAPLEPKRILVIATTALGDTLWATPALTSIKAAYPKSHLALLTSPIGYEALQHHPAIDAFHLLKEPVLPRALSLYRALKKGRYDAALLFHASQRLALPLAALAGIPRIIGTAGINKGLDALLTDPIAPVFEHEIIRRLRLAEALGAPRTTELLSYTVTAKERAAAQKQLSSFKGPLVAMHPGSKEPFRRWPPSCFAAVGKQLQKRFGCELFLTGTPAELPLLQKIRQELPSAHIVEPGSIRSLAALLEQMDLLVSNDTGPMHLACALNRPAVALYVSTDALLCGPHKAPRATAITRPPTCIPCLKRKCQEAFCFLQIPPAEVVEACASYLCR